MAYWYLKDRASNTFDLGNYVKEMQLGSSKRNYNVVENAGSNGGQIKGWGNYSPKEFVVIIPLKAGNADATYMNRARTTINQWFTRASTETINLYIEEGDATSPITKYTRVYCTELGTEKFNCQRGIIEKQYKLLSPSGYFINASAKSYNATITDSTTYELSVVNAGDIEVPVLVSFTPTANETLFQCELYDGFGFQISATYFNATEAVIYNTANNVMTISGQSVNTTNYLTGGSVFSLPVGTQTLYIKTSGLGSTAINVTFYERFV
jgi:hypothetical protein